MSKRKRSVLPLEPGRVEVRLRGRHADVGHLLGALAQVGAVDQSHHYSDTAGSGRLYLTITIRQGTTVAEPMPDERLAKIRRRWDETDVGPEVSLSIRGSRKPGTTIDALRHSVSDVPDLLAELYDSRSREHALAEEVEGLREEVDRLRADQAARHQREEAERELLRGELAARGSGTWDETRLVPDRLMAIIRTAGSLHDTAAAPITATPGTEEYGQAEGWARGTRSAVVGLEPYRLVAEVGWLSGLVRNLTRALITGERAAITLAAVPDHLKPAPAPGDAEEVGE